ncbi:ATPase [Streptomyces sp. A7024]|uniref:ATPase n=1 Tax=Streptomyces coryli TaxID=1128680 RepID=A0A6G4TXE4_9ACTN|nr:RNase adapter RapZ [Streptomyces coryli]NGN64116.1 ATPase [Streptomyces coryli]
MAFPCVEITSFGYLHAAPPAAHLTIDLRHHFRDPHVSPAMKYLTAHDAEVRTTVLNTPGIGALVDSTAMAVAAFALGPSAQKVRVAVGCAGGRHRAPTFAMALAAQLRALGFEVTVNDLDLAKPVVHR